MFDLNRAIVDWRARLAVQPDVEKGDLDELEDHLREGCAELEAQGLSTEEAFLIAARRLGDPREIAGEFAAADPQLRRRLRLRWIVVGALALLALAFLAELATALFASGLHLFHFSMSPLTPLIVPLQLVIFALGGLLIWRLLTRDDVAGRLRQSGLWGLGLLLLLLVAAAVLSLAPAGHHLVARAGPIGSLHQLHYMTMSALSHWLRFSLLALPVLFLAALWLLARPRGGKGR